MSQVRFGRDDQGQVTVLVPEGSEPLWDLLRQDLLHNRRGLNAVLDCAREPTEPEDDIGTNTTSVTVTAETVTVENIFTDEVATFPRAEFVEIMQSYLRELDAAATERPSI